MREKKTIKLETENKKKSNDYEENRDNKKLTPCNERW